MKDKEVKISIFWIPAYAGMTGFKEMLSGFRIEAGMTGFKEMLSGFQIEAGMM